MSLCVLGLAYALTNTVSVFEDMTAALGALFVATTVLLIPPAYLLYASAQSDAGDAEAGSPPKMGTGEVITIKKGDAPTEKKAFKSPLKKNKPEMVDPSTPPKYGASGSVTEDGFERVSGAVSAPLRVFLYVSIAFALVAVPFLTWGASCSSRAGRRAALLVRAVRHARVRGGRGYARRVRGSNLRPHDAVRGAVPLGAGVPRRAGHHGDAGGSFGRGRVPGDGQPGGRGPQPALGGAEGGGQLAVRPGAGRPHRLRDAAAVTSARGVSTRDVFIFNVVS